MCSRSMATTFSTVPYLVSPVTWRGCSFQRNRACQSRSRAGWLSCTSAGVTKRGEDDPRLAAVDDVMVVVPQTRTPGPRRQRGGVGVGGAGAEVGRPAVGPAGFAPVGLAGSADPVVAGGRGNGQVGPRRLRQVDRKRGRRRRVVSASFVATATGVAIGEQAGQVGLDGEARLEGVERRIGLDLGGVKVELLAPDQAGGDALRGDRREEAAEDVEPVALPDAGEAGMVGQRLGQVVPQVPAQAEAVGDHPQQLSFGAQPLEEEDQLQLEEDDRVDRAAARCRRRPRGPDRGRNPGRAYAPDADRSGRVGRVPPTSPAGAKRRPGLSSPSWRFAPSARRVSIGSGIGAARGVRHGGSSSDRFVPPVAGPFAGLPGRAGRCAYASGAR